MEHNDVCLGVCYVLKREVTGAAVRQDRALGYALTQEVWFFCVKVGAVGVARVPSSLGWGRNRMQKLSIWTNPLVRCYPQCALDSGVLLLPVKPHHGSSLSLMLPPEAGIFVCVLY